MCLGALSAQWLFRGKTMTRDSVRRLWRRRGLSPQNATPPITMLPLQSHAIPKRPLDWNTMTHESSSPTDWQQSSLEGLASLTVDAMPAVEVLLLDDIAAYLMGAGPLQPPYTVEHGSRIVSALLGAIVNSARFTPEQVPAPTPQITTAREQVVRGAHDFAARGVGGVNHLANRLIPAAIGELETHKDSPEKQTCLLFYYALLAVASGPRNLLDEDAAAGAMHVFRAWDELFGQGYLLPWRRAHDTVRAVKALGGELP